MQDDASDYLTIKSYDNSNGDLELYESFENYHYGAANAPVNEFGGVDMRGEVILLSRSIQIEGDGTDDWGCTIVTTEMLADPATNEFIIGDTIMDNVEVRKCSQKDTE